MVRVICSEDIGSWFVVLTILGFVAVLTNATMIAFVGSQLASSSHEKNGIIERSDSAKLWIYAVATEHVVMLLRVCVLVILPSYPVRI